MRSKKRCPAVGTFSRISTSAISSARPARLFATKTNEPSVKLESFTILAKALRPPPAKWHGLEDTEIRYRQRYLDLMANPDVKDVMLKRSEIIHEIRNFLHERGYVEVETPMMQAIPGGAAAQPFKTHHNALGCDFYLRIALELYLKRLLVGGMDKVFEIGRNFRNEGLSRKHNPEFTMLEAYQAFGDYETMMKLVEAMICHVAQKVLGTLKIPRNRTKDLTFIFAMATEWLNESKGHILEIEDNENNRAFANSFIEKLNKCSQAIGTKSFWEIAKEAAPIVEEAVQALKQIYSRPEISSKLSKEIISEDLESVDSCRLKFYRIIERRIYRFELYGGAQNTKIWSAKKREQIGLKFLPQHVANARTIWARKSARDYADFEVTGAVFEKLIEPTLIQPTFVTHLPKELVPLAKLSPDDPTTVEVFECCINGQEISPGYTEQNDPIEQRERLEHQAGGEQQKLDEDFLVALEHGMPPAGGIGIGIDRLCMMLLGQESIRDVILFPQLKPKT